MQVPKQLFIGDLSLEQIAVIEERMRPGGFADSDFLGGDERLVDVIQADTKVLARLGITHKQVGDRLDYLTGRARRLAELASRAHERGYHEALKNGYLIDNHFKVSAVGYLGRVSCPFFFEKKRHESGHGIYIYTCGGSDYDYTIKNKKQGTEIKFPAMMGHLIRDHHFFEGDTPYRLEPEEVVKVLELKPGVDYTPKIGMEVLWETTCRTFDPNEDFCGSHGLIRESKQQIDITSGFRLYASADTRVFVAKEDIQLAEPVRIDAIDMTYSGTINRGQWISRKREHKYVVG